MVPYSLLVTGACAPQLRMRLMKMKDLNLRLLSVFLNLVRDAVFI